MLFGVFGWRLDARGGRRRVRPGPPWKGWTTGTGCTTGSATGDGPSGGAASHGAPRRAGIPSTGNAAATGDGATSGAAHRLTAAASDPTLRCTTAASCPARGGTAA
ncbi:hypothetical protein AYJ54_03230 [Bradyrhizobium centrolobii]|uniref:Uncharacterized protein n=1 Tax=Bradyrhizobium centrolobii TaxID=1505087 RepID=A0A176YEB0_9BRAD|nr:hypothetical protein [Bradyrhizobium centrolobii]OAF03545.1 hypothetical protein AYJ54_03230 [Bradyrhizobium centrolobii]